MTSTRMRWAAGIAAVSAVAMVVAGCSKNGATTSNKQAQKKEKQVEKKAASLPGTDMIKATRDQIKDGGVLNLAIENFPANFNPAEADANEVGIIPFYESTLPQFVTSDEAGDAVANPNYTKSFKIVSQNPFQVEYVLNPKAVWSDGTPIGYQDFLSQWKANNGSNKAFLISSTNGWEVISKVEKGANDQDVKITFKRPYAAWPYLFNYLIPAKYTATPKAFNTAWKTKPAVSGGPFIASKLDSTAKVVTETPNPKWWGDKPKLSQINLRFLELNATTGAFANGELDAVDAGKDVNTLKQSEGVSGSKVLRSATVGLHVFNFNARSPLLKDVKVRQALVQAINRDQIAKVRLQPFGAPVQTRNSELYASIEPGYTDNASSVIGYNPTKAKQTLASLGWKMQGKKLMKNGKAFTLREVIPSETSSQSQVSEVIQQSLANIGVTVKIQTVPSNDFFTKYIQVGDFDINYQGWTAGNFPECDAKSQYFPATSPQNYPGVTTPEIGKLFDEACGTLDATARHKLGNELDKQLWALAGQIAVFTDPAVAVVKGNLVNYDGITSAFQAPVWENVGWKK